MHVRVCASIISGQSHQLFLFLQSRAACDTWSGTLMICKKENKKEKRKSQTHQLFVQHELEASCEADSAQHTEWIVDERLERRRGRAQHACLKVCERVKA
jgi:hypothetical protein